MNINLAVRMLDSDLTPPGYAHVGDAGLDLRSSIDVTIQPFERTLIPTGVAVAIPTGYAGFVQPRSGLAISRGLSLVNTPGLIDSGYRGELQVIAINLDPDTPITISRGDKIAQLVIQPVATAQISVVDTLDETGRADGGFGSTGVQ